MNPNLAAVLALEQPFFRDFGAQDAQSLAALARPVRFAPGEIVFREGEGCDDFYLLVSGRLLLEITPPSGAFPVDTVGPGEEFGWTAVLAGQDRVLQARALEECRALAFEGQALRALCEANPAFGYHFMRRLLGASVDRLEAVRLQLTDAHWPVAHRAGA